MQKCKSLSLCAMFGGLVVRWWGGIACFAYFVPALLAWFGGCVETLESRCVWACSGVGNAWAVVGLAKILQNLCKNR